MRSLGSTWFSSDLHLGHANIIQYCNRPFDSVEDMNEGLIDAWNDVVAPTDQVFILGDLALGRIRDTLQLVSRLAGHKILIPGNHDRCWSGASHRTPDWSALYLQNVQEIRRSSASSQPSLNHPALKRPVALSHFPYTGDSGPSDRFLDARPIDRGEWLLHGHVHDVWRQRNRQVNVGIDAWGGRPVHIDEIAALIAAGPQDLTPLPWR